MKALRTITYTPELNQITGSINATILMCQLEYWFAKCSGQSFYKFLAPCENEYYRPGDSWCEELGFSKPEFRSAFIHIGKVYKSKKAYTKSTDPFEGKLYLSYYDRIRRRTYYLRNHDLVHTTLGQASLAQHAIITSDSTTPISPTSSATSLVNTTVASSVSDSIPSASSILNSPAPNDSAPQPLTMSSHSTPLQILPIVDKYIPTKSQTVSPIEHYECIPTNSQTASPITEDYNTDLPTKNTTRDDSETSDLHTSVLSLYHQLCPELPKIIALTPTRRRMIDTLLHTLGGSLSLIRTLFERVASSDFLCGRLPNKKWQALFDWIITSTNSLAILDGKYDTWTSSTQAPLAPSVATRSTNATPYKNVDSTCTTNRPTMPSTRGRNAFTTMYTHNWDLDALEELAYQHFENQLTPSC